MPPVQSQTSLLFQGVCQGSILHAFVKVGQVHYTHKTVKQGLKLWRSPPTVCSRFCFSFSWRFCNVVDPVFSFCGNGLLCLPASAALLPAKPMFGTAPLIIFGGKSNFPSLCNTGMLGIWAVRAVWSKQLTS